MSIFSRAPAPRKGMPSPRLDEAEFKRRFSQHFADPNFSAVESELAAVAQVAWENYEQSRKSPVTRKAGPDYADPDYDLSVDWLRARDGIRDAERCHADPNGPARILIINGSPRSEHTCPGEMSKSWRLMQTASEVFESEANFATEVLDLSRTVAEYGRSIHPCKACFSTAAPLCHWPCSCYPNHSLGQAQDWMNDIYPMWVEAHGILIVTPVHWYQSPSPLKLMIDRLVCADGGNPDPTSTHGKDASAAKAMELKGWDYPRHLAGRMFAVVVHGDTEGVENLRRSLVDWLRSLELLSVGATGELDRYIGYWKPYATSHDELDADEALQDEVRNAARALARAVTARRDGRFFDPGAGLDPPRPK